MRMVKNRFIYTIIFTWVCCFIQPVLRAENDVLPVMEMSADRVTIYPQRMELNGEETLFDLLQMCPRLLTNGFDSWLENYEIRIDNGPYGGDMRVLLSEMKASVIDFVQISDYPGVLKGTTGTFGCVDIFLKPLEKGAHGEVGAEVAHDLTSTPYLEFRYGSDGTDILTNASYNYQNRTPFSQHRQYSNFHMLNRFGEKDQLLTYFTQAYERTGEYANLSSMYPYATISRADSRLFSGQLRHYHYLNPNTLFMTAVVYQHLNSPGIDVQTNDTLSSEKLNVVAAVEEFSTVFFDKLELLVGVELDYVMGKDKYSYLHSNYANSDISDTFYGDLYVSLSYSLKNWNFGFGDRVRYNRYHIRLNDYLVPNEYVEHRCHNMLHASVIFKPATAHQIQALYARKYFEPAYLLDFEEAPINEVKLAYSFAQPNVTANFDVTYANYTWPTIQPHHLRADAAAWYKYRFFSVTAGVSVEYSYVSALQTNTSASFRLSPTFDLPLGMQVKARSIFFTPSSPYRNRQLLAIPYPGLHITGFPYTSGPVYAELQFTKYWKHLDLYAIWHDIFNGQYGIATLGVRAKI